LVDGLLILLEVAMVRAISNLTYHYVELKGIEVGRRLARSQPRPLSPV
jgi:peptidoglycan/LPS O-acetylase OafA/YrhL